MSISDFKQKILTKISKPQKSSFNTKLGCNVYDYDPKFFKIDLLINDFNIDEENFKLGNAQHVIAKLCGLEKWSDLSKASSAKIELSRLLYTNMDIVEVLEWNTCVSDIETENKVKLDDEFKLQIFKEVFLKGRQDVYYDSYRLAIDEETDMEWELDEHVSNTSTVKISSLPLTREDRQEFIKIANLCFERVFEGIEPENPELTRSLWDAEKYIIEDVLTTDRLPIDYEDALSIIDAFMLAYVIQLAVEADKIAANSK